jgi:hypothetical protein
MSHHLPAERQVADIVLADLQRELLGLGPGEERLGRGEGGLGQIRRDAMIGDDEKPGVLAGAGDGARQRRRRARFAGKVRPDVEDRDAAVVHGVVHRVTVAHRQDTEVSHSKRP